jgi:hypothetical protein
MGPIRRLPLRYSLTALVVGLALVGLKAWAGDQADEHGWGWDAVADVLGVLAGVALASAGINEVVLRLTDRDRLRRTGPIVTRRLQAALDDASLVTRAAALTAATVAPRAAGHVDETMRVPQTEASRALLGRLRGALREAADAAKSDESAANAVAAEARRVYPDATAAAARCAEALDAIATLRPGWAVDLANAGTYLEAATRDVQAPASAGATGGHIAAMNVGALFAVAQLLEVLDGVHTAEERVGADGFRGYLWPRPAAEALPGHDLA